MLDTFKKLAQQGVASVSQAATSAVQGLGSVVSQINESTFERFFTVVDIPGFVLPTGPHEDDYFLQFEFNEVLKRLSSGTLVRPRLVIFAGRDDMNRKLLADRINTNFTRAFEAAKNSARQKVADSSEVTSHQIKSEQIDLNKHGTEAVSGVLVALIGMFLAANPVVDVIFLLMAVFGGKKAIQIAFRYVSTIPQMITHQNKVSVQLSEVEKTFTDKEGAFEEAVNNLVIHLHPRLRQLCCDLCEVNAMEKPRVSQTVQETVPSVEDHLRSARYRSALSEIYHGLLG